MIYFWVIHFSKGLAPITKEKIDIDGDCLVEGYRSDYSFPCTPNRSWENSLQIMHEKLESFKKEDYEFQGIINSHFDETTKWDSEDEILYRYFKYDLRKKLSPVITKEGVSREKIFAWFERLPECCNQYYLGFFGLYFLVFLYIVPFC